MTKTLIAIFEIQLLLQGLFFVPDFIRISLKWIFIALALIGMLSGEIRFENTFYNKCIFLYCASLMVSGIIGGYFSLGTILSTLQFIFMTLCVIGFGKNSRVVLIIFLKRISKLIYISIGYSLVLMLFGNIIFYEDRYINYLGSYQIRQYAYGIQGQRLGYSGLYLNSNVFAFFILIVLINHLFGEEEENKIKKSMKFCWLIVGIIISDSRAIFVCGVIVLAVYLICGLKKRISEKEFNVLVLLTIFVSAAFLALFGTDLLNVWNRIDLAGREDMWKIMIESIEKHPFFGIGFSISTKYLLGDISTGYTVGSHNSYLNILCENGFIGFFFFAIMMIYVCEIAYNRKYIFAENKMANVALMIYLIYIPYAFIENAYMIVDGKSYLWILVCKYIEFCCTRNECSQSVIIGLREEK